MIEEDVNQDESYAKQKAIEFLVKYHDSDYCYEEDGFLFLEADKPKITISELYDILMNNKNKQ